VAEEVAGESGVQLFHLLIDKQKVVNQRFIASCVEISKIFAAEDGFSVTSVVIDDADIAVAAEEFHKRKVPFLVLAHSVGELDDAFGLSALVGIGRKTTDLKTVLA
jgi:hypothetical protein